MTPEIRPLTSDARSLKSEVRRLTPDARDPKFSALRQHRRAIDQELRA